MEQTTAVIEDETTTPVVPSQQRRSRVWLLTNGPSPYQVELLSAVSALGESELQVRFMRVPENSAVESLPEGALQYSELRGLAPRWWRDEFRMHPGALRETAWGDYDAYILSGLSTSVTFMLCAAVLWLRGKPWAVWLERPRAAKRRWIGMRAVQRVKVGLLQWILRRATCVIGIGSEAVQAYERLGAVSIKTAMLPYCCDVRRFEDVDADRTESVRQHYQLQGKTVFLFSGQMIHRKGVDVALSAFARLAETVSNVALLLLGGGPRFDEYRESVPADLRDRVHFTGLLPQSELPAHFSAADVFVFPSRHDGWGVVVNEACAAGLPVIASRQTGAALDLVREGENGFIVDCEDPAGFAERMRFFAEHSEEIRRYGSRSRELVRPYSAEAGARTFQAHVSHMIVPEGG